MFTYYVGLALRSLRRNVALTLLMVAAIGAGVGASMTVFTVLSAMGSDPIPDKSSQLFVPQVDNWGPDAIPASYGYQENQLSYRDAMAFIHAHRGLRQTALYAVQLNVTPPAAMALPFSADGQAVYSDFFKMFDVPFRAGGAWSTEDDRGRSNVAVISDQLAKRLFPSGGALGHGISLNARQYQIVGVLAPWDPRPRYYNVVDGSFGEGDDVFIPFSTAIDRQIPTAGDSNCDSDPGPGWFGHLNSECIWIKFWVELPTAAAVRGYRQFLYNYAAEAQRSGRFHWAPQIHLRDLRRWLVFEKVVPAELRISTLVAFGFLMVCLINAVGLMLTRFNGRGGELGLRRALGASRTRIFIQCLVEAGTVGLLGGLLGLALTVLGLSIERAMLSVDVAAFAHLNASMVVSTVALAIVAALCSGLYPAWRASRVQPIRELKAQ